MSASPAPSPDDALVIRRQLTVPLAVPPGPAPLRMGEAGRDGLRLSERSVEWAGRPWFPIMGEYHFSRDRPERWERELAKMKAGGITTVASYVLWILHEERRDILRWDGALDLRRFVETAHRVGLHVVVRLGPWAHGETRNGGFPDWLQALPVAHRSDDPAYLHVVRGWFAAIAEQLAGLFRTAATPDAPIVGLQLENELYDQPEHLRTLRALAEELGMTAPLWLATGWGGAQLPRDEVLPVYAGYADGFWAESDTGWPEFGAQHFTFSTVRDDLSVGADLREPQDADARDQPAARPGPGASEPHEPWPYATCELGGGMTTAYHRRPLVDAADVAALALTKLGSGSAWQGYYLFHGGTQRQGELSTTQESQETGYPNDVPVRDYDFYAPLGAQGQQRPHFHQLRQQHLFLTSFGATFAAHPSVLPVSDTVRWAVRGDGSRGYLFLNNHQPAAAPLPEVSAVRFQVDLAQRRLTVPSTPFTLRSGCHARWPLRQAFGSIPALTCTADPVTSLVTATGPLVIFAATPGVPVELQLEDVAASTVQGARVQEREGLLFATPLLAPGLDCEVRVGDTTLLFLDAATAATVWRGEIAGRDSVVLWPGSAWFDGDFRVELPVAALPLAVTPPLQECELLPLPRQGSVFSRYEVPGGAPVTELPPPHFPVPALAPIRTGGSAGRLAAPGDDDFAALPPVELPIPDALFDGAEQLLLECAWTGDVVRVYAGEELIMDQFFSGRPLELDLLPHRARIGEAGLWLRAFAWAPDSAVYVDPRVRPTGSAAVLEIHGAVLRRITTRGLR